MTILAPNATRETVRYEFETVTVQRPVHSLAGVLRGTWAKTLAVCILTLIAAQFLVTPLLQSRSQMVAGRELAARFDVARGAMGMTDLSPLPNEPVAVGTPLAVLSIPSLRLQQIVAEGASAAQLQHGPGHVSGTVGIGERGVSIIAGRRAAWGAPFGAVPSLKVGDSVTATTVAGRVEYKVTQVTTVAPDLRAPTGAMSRLVLQTSSPAGLALSDSYIVADSVKPAFPSTPQNRLPDVGVRGGDLTALPQAVLWIALLVLFVGLARYWVVAGVMDRVLAWSLATPVLALAGLLALRALSSLLPATL